MNVYIDLGAFRGLYVNRFRRSKYYTPGTKIYAFECNPDLANFDYGTDVIKISMAAWVYDGDVSFYVSKRNPRAVQGSTVYQDKITGNLDKDAPIKTPCMDFSKFLSDNFTIADNVMAKINIEGAEYDILEKCISDGTISILKTIWVSWHYQKCKIPQERHISLTNKLRLINGLTVYNGAGDLKC